MKIFLTGATGLIGTPTLTHLTAQGHTVLCLSRTSTSASTITSLGGIPHHGTLTDFDALRSGAAQCDAVIHLAWMSDFTKFKESCEIDRAAVRAMVEGLEQGSGGGGGKGKAMVICSGTLGVRQAEGQVADEETPDEWEGTLAERGKTWVMLKEMSGGDEGKEVRGMLVRFAPSVHGEGDRGFVAAIIALAREKGDSFYVKRTGEGEGPARWPAVNKDDAAVLLGLCVEKGRNGGVYNASAEEGVEIRELAEVVGRKLGVKVRGLEGEEAQKEMGFLAFVLDRDNRTSSARTRKELGWEPKALGWLEDVERNYFTEEALREGAKFAM